MNSKESFGFRKAMVILIERGIVPSRFYFGLFRKINSPKTLDVPYWRPNLPETEGVYYGGELGTISGVDERDKKSGDFHDCVCLVGFGNKGKEKLSILGHLATGSMGERSQSLSQVTPADAVKFRLELVKRFKHLIEISDKGSVEICLTAGDSTSQMSVELIKETERCINDAFKDSGVKVKIMYVSPGTHIVQDVFVHTARRRVYLLKEVEKIDE